MSPRIARGCLLGLFLVALAVRALYLAEARAVPLHHTLISDGRAYYEWAERIVSGDWASTHQGVFYQAPLYPYFLAGIRSVFGPGLLAIRVVQACLGALACVFLAIAGWRLFSPAAGIAAGAILALYAPAIFFDGVVQKTSLSVFLLTSLLAISAGLVKRPTAHGWFAAGVAAGLLVLVRENALLLLPVLVLWAGCGVRGARMRSPLVLIAGVGLVLLPVALRNQAVGGVFALTTSQAGPNLYIGNNAAATGTYAPLVRGRSDTPFERHDAVTLAEAAIGRPLDPTEVSRYWRDRALAFVRDEPGAWLRLMLRKTLMTLHRYEQPDGEEIETYAEASLVLRLVATVGHAGVVVPLGVAGLVLTAGHRRRLWPFHLVLGAFFVGVVVFFVFGRYRMPVIVTSMPFAGAALVSLLALVRRRALPSMSRRGWIALGSGVLAAVVANAPVDLGQVRNRAMAHTNVGVALADQERWGEAAAAYRRALAVEPELLEAHLNLGSTLRVLGEHRSALEHLDRAYTLAPDDPEVVHQLGQAHLQTGSLARAEPLLRRAVELAPAMTVARVDLSTVLLRGGRWAEAITMLRAGARVTPEDALLRSRLAAALVQAPGRTAADLAEAAGHADVACMASGFRDLEIVRTAVGVHLARGDRAAVRTLARRALPAAEAAGDDQVASALRALLAGGQ